MKNFTMTLTLALLIVAPALPSASAVIKCKDSLEADIWMVRSGGLWASGDSRGTYRVIVTRRGVEHSRDDVQVQLIRIEGRSRIVDRCVDLNSPGNKGYVHDIRIHSINSRAVSIEIAVEMKAMEGVVLQDVFVVSADGASEKIADAVYRDLFALPLVDGKER